MSPKPLQYQLLAVLNFNTHFWHDKSAFGAGAVIRRQGSKLSLIVIFSVYGEYTIANDLSLSALIS
jgi:hypothetical protein